jgi:hypothetical protein
MRIVNVAAPKGQPFDRNPTTTCAVDNNAARTPNVLTQRWLYTCPANRRANIDMVSCAMNRQTAGAPVGNWQSYVSISAPATSAYPIYHFSSDNTLNVPKQAVATQCGVLVATGFVESDQVDTSTGGTVAYTSAVKITEFDA